MKILSIDTASSICGVSILDEKKLLCRLDCDTGRTHSENLMPMIRDAFEKVNLSLSDMDLIVCDKGPGSFTGIRIGIATAKAFSDSMNLPCVGVSSLEALAYNVKLIDKFESNFSGLVCSLIDCGNCNCYYALYKFEDGVCNTVVEPCSDSIENALVSLSSYSDIVFIGDGCITYRNEILSKFPNCLFADDNLLNSYSLGIAGLELYQKSLDKNFSDILPLYLKKPQAQRQLEMKLGISDEN